MDAAAVSSATSSVAQNQRAVDVKPSQNAEASATAARSSAQSVEFTPDQVVNASAEENADTYQYDSEGHISQSSTQGNKKAGSFFSAKA